VVVNETYASSTPTRSYFVRVPSVFNKRVYRRAYELYSNVVRAKGSNFHKSISFAFSSTSNSAPSRIRARARSAFSQPTRTRRAQRTKRRRTTGQLADVLTTSRRRCNGRRRGAPHTYCEAIVAATRNVVRCAFYFSSHPDARAGRSRSETVAFSKRRRATVASNSLRSRQLTRTKVRANELTPERRQPARRFSIGRPKRVSSTRFPRNERL